MRQPPKTYEQALAEAIRVLSGLLNNQVDFIEGSKALSLAEAVAFQAADLSERQEQSITDAVPEAIFSAFGFARQQATLSTGALTFSAPGASPVPVFIPAGTEARSDGGALFVTLQDVTLSTGQTSINAPAVASVAGIAGNIPSGAVTRLTSGVPGIQGVSNLVPFSGGAAAETLDQQRTRFTVWLDTLDQSSLVGLTNAARSVVIPGIGSVDEVLTVDGNIDATIPAGNFKMFLYRQGGVPVDLITAITAAVEARRAAGCIPTVQAVAGTPVGITASFSVRSPGVTAYARAALDVYFGSLKFGEKASRENLITVLTTCHPAILEVTLTDPAADVPCTMYAHLEPGAVALSEAT
jgi:hypothetical protein